MKLRIEITLDNAAFGEAGSAECGNEIGRILMRLANDLRESDVKAGYSQILRDVNGNTVGRCETKGRR